MKNKIETVFIFIFLLLFSLATIYPVLNILGVSLRTDNAFQNRSISIIQARENYIDLNNNGQWDNGESFVDTNNNGKKALI